MARLSFFADPLLTLQTAPACLSTITNSLSQVAADLQKESEQFQVFERFFGSNGILAEKLNGEVSLSEVWGDAGRTRERTRGRIVDLWPEWENS